jgi:two-component system response regulator AtoC
VKPAATLDGEPTGDAADESWGSCRGAHVLVVDDDPDLRALLALRLERAGCVVHQAESGIEAQALLGAGEPGEQVELLLIDLRMPEVSGLEVLAALHAARRLPPAILMTGFAEARIRTEALAIGIHVLDKPFAFDTLRCLAVALILSKRVVKRRASYRPGHGSSGP